MKCFYCDSEFVDSEIENTCDKCLVILRDPKYGIRLLRGALYSKLRGTMSEQSIRRNIEMFVLNFKR